MFTPFIGFLKLNMRHRQNVVLRSSRLALGMALKPRNSMGSHNGTAKARLTRGTPIYFFITTGLITNLIV